MLLLLEMVKGEGFVRLKFRGLLIEDADWITEAENDPEAAKYWEDFPRTEHEFRGRIKKKLEEAREKTIVAELDGEPAGSVSVEPETGRCRHVAWLGIFVKRKHWGKGVGSALMEEAIKLARQLGCRKLMLGTTEGNERAIGLYKKFGFEIEAYLSEYSYVDGSWRKEYIMGLELAPCKPKIRQSMLPPSRQTSRFIKPTKRNINVRQLMDHDLDEVHRLQNCPESTKSSSKVPPIPKEENKRWYEGLNSREGKYCLACFEDKQLLGYLRFRAGRLPSLNLRFEEIMVDVNKKPGEAADALIEAIKGFKNRYGYRGIFAHIPQTSSAIVDSLERHSFKNAGAMKCYYFIDGHYVDAAVYGYP
jgi:RimJ/RimL family protein N-acetyltransferase